MSVAQNEGSQIHQLCTKMSHFELHPCAKVVERYQTTSTRDNCLEKYAVAIYRDGALCCVCHSWHHCARTNQYVLVEQVELKEPGQATWTPNPSKN